MYTKIKRWWTVKRRAYLYRVLGGLAVLVAPISAVAGEKVGVWVALVFSFIGVLVAAANTPTE